ncbi:MAG: NAD(P)/FAD-dependent oxidoreductase, partial [Crocinitomicaceae bacterium]|nr:NAD(P)/FAD-dependent oxidoreductase [Crocinitomicaceae bacterium]
MIEADKIGGAGVYKGALSSKTLWEISNRVAYINETLVGEGRKSYEPQWSQIKKTLDEAIFERKFQYSCHIKLLQNETELKSFKYKRGWGSLLSEHEVLIVHGDQEETIWGENIILATGSRPRKISSIPVDEKSILTSDGIDSLTDYP